MTALAGFNQFVSQMKRLKWVSMQKRPFDRPEYVLKYLARYTHRGAISGGRLISCENGRVSFRWRDSANGNQQKVMTLDAVEFIRRFLQHVLPSGFLKIRHFGFLANPCRKKALLLVRTLLPSGAPAEHSRRSNATQVERGCPACGRGRLCVLGWLPPSLATVLQLAVNSS